MPTSGSQDSRVAVIIDESEPEFMNGQADAAEQEVSMRVQLLGSGVNVTPAIREHVMHRLRLALGRFANRVNGVVVRLTDVNGPRGGVDVHCCMRVRGKDVEGLFTTALAVEPETAINQATVRLRRVIRRAIARPEERRRSRGPNRPPL